MSLNSGDLRFWLQLAAFVALAAAAWRWGGGPERVLSAVLVWFNVADAANHAIFGRWTDLNLVDEGHLVIDSIALAVALATALRANRVYPLWFAALQVVALLAHLAQQLAASIAPLAYAVVAIGPSYCQIIVLAIGLWMHRRRVLAFGPYPSWRTSSPPGPPPPARSGSGRGWPGGSSR